MKDNEIQHLCATLILNVKSIFLLYNNYQFGSVPISYMRTHMHWAGVTRISEKLPAMKILVDFTHIRSNSPASKL